MNEYAENPLHAHFYADGAIFCNAMVHENELVAHNTFRVRFNCPPIARAITPGQFIMLRLAECDDPLLARPLALYETASSSNGDAQYLDIVYLVSGKFTRRMMNATGQLAQLWGPLGNGFPLQSAGSSYYGRGRDRIYPIPFARARTSRIEAIW